MKLRLTVFVLTALMTSFVLAWGGGHDTVGECVLKKLSPKWAAKWDAKWLKAYNHSTHASDAGKFCKDIQSENDWFLSNGWKLGYGMHNDEMQMMFIVRLAEAIKRGDDKSAFLILAAISHNFADGGALNHDPLVHFQTYIWGVEGLKVCPPMQSDFVFCGTNPDARKVMLKTLETLEVPKAGDYSSWKDLLAKLVEIRESSAQCAMSVANWDVLNSSIAWSSKKTPERAEALAKAFMPSGMWGVKWTLWALATAENIAKKDFPIPTADEAKKERQRIVAASKVFEKRTLEGDQSARQFLPKSDKPCTIGLLYDPMSFHTSGIGGIGGNIYAMLFTSTLRKMFPEENIGILNWRLYDKQSFDEKTLKCVIFISHGVHGANGFNVDKFKKELRGYVQRGGNVMILEWPGVQEFVASGKKILNTSSFKNGYAVPAFIVSQDDVMKSKIHWLGDNPQTFTFHVPPRGKAGWPWMGGRYWVDDKKLTEPVRELLAFEAPDGTKYIQGFAWPKDDPKVAYLPGFLAMGYLLTDEKLKIDPFEFRLDAATSGMIGETLKLLIKK